MKLYKDYQLKEEITNFDLGKVMVGESHEYSFYVYNETEAELEDLNFTIDSSEITIVDYPSSLKSKEKGTLKIKYNPSITIKKGLKAKLSFKGTEVYS